MKGKRGKAEKKHTRSLATQVLVGMVAMLAVCVVMITTVFTHNMREMSMQAERDHFEEMGKALHSMVTESLDGLYEMTRAYSSYDESYWFARGYNTSYLMRFFEDGSTLAIGDVDFVVILDRNGDELFSGSRFVEAGAPLEPVPDGLRRRVALSCDEVIENHKVHNGTFQVEGPVGETGFVVVDGQSYQLCVLPILRDRDDGEPVGVFAFAKKFGNEQIRRLTDLDVSEFSIAEQDPANPVLATAYEIDGDTAVTHTPLESRDGSPNAILTFATPRTLYDNVNAIMVLTIALLVLFIVTALTALFVFLHLSLVKPLKRLTGDLRALDESNGLDTGKYSGTREFFTLTSTVNNTLSRLEESHRAEERSKVSLNILKNILNGMDAYLYVMDPETNRILFINDNMRTHFGLEGDGMGQICWQVLQDGFSEPCSFCPNQWLMEHPEEHYVWEEHNTATGRYYRNTDRLIDWMDGKKAHMQHSVDITDIKLAEQKLQRRLEQQALMTKISKLFISGGDAAANVDRALAMAGEFLDASRVMYLPLSEHKDKVLFANEWLSPREAVPSRLGGSAPVQGELEAFLEQIMSGAVTHYTSAAAGGAPAFKLGFTETPSYLAVPVLANDELYGILDFGDTDPDTQWSESDISLAQLMASILSGYFGRLAAEDQIRLLSSLVEYSSVLITNIERDGTLIYVNDAVLDITGYTPGEFMQCGLPLLFGANEMRLIETKYIPEVIKNGECRFEIELTRKDGAKRTITYSTFMMGGESGTIGAIASDITDLRELERQLTAARDLAEQGNRAKTEFLSRMSHEMRTPMNAIIGMTNIARQSEETAKKEHCLERIDSASHHLLGVINDILDMSKIEANKFELSMSDFSFAAMLQSVMNVVHFRLDEKHQKMQLDVDPELPDHLVGDEQRLAQVLTNLLANAAKFTPENGEVGLSVKVESQKWADLVLKFAVRDNGIGISPEQMGRLFRPFEQADGSISRRYGGTGLGLAISKQIINLMGGDIRVESEVGKGSSFIFTVNVRKAADLGIEPMRADGGDGGGVDGIFEGKRVLLAEDVEVNCEIVKAILEDTGVALDTASNGTEAVRMFLADPAAYDMILMDVQMPEKDGLEATREIRALDAKQGKTVPIIALTANVFREDVELYLREGMNSHVQKPVDFDELIRVMRKFIGGR